MPLKGFTPSKKKPRATPGDDRKLDRSGFLREMNRLAPRIAAMSPIRPRGEDGKRAPRAPKEDASGPDPERTPTPTARTADVPPEPVHGWDRPLRRPKGE